MKKRPPLYEALPTPAEMAQWDKAAYALFGIPSLLLMENAAWAAFAALDGHVPLTMDCRVLVFMGRGNNGGDGAALARLLHDRGCKVLLCPTRHLDGLQSPAQEHLDMARKTGVAVMPVNEQGMPSPLPPEWNHPDVVVDAIVGTGLKNDLRGPELDCVRLVNSFGGRPFIFSLDIPSGLCGLSGEPKPECVRATATVSFEAGKPGLFMPWAAKYVGLLEVRRVGIPLAVRAAVPPSWNLLAPAKGSFSPLSPLRHKGDAGKVLIVGGSGGMAGAPFLAALGALRAGAGLVHVACPDNIAPQGALPEIQLHRIGKVNSTGREQARLLIELVDSLDFDSIVVGPGLGRGKSGANLLAALLEHAGRPPMIVDADALYPLNLESAPGGVEQCIRAALLGPDDIATPHPGELARMLPADFFAQDPKNGNLMPGRAGQISRVQQNRHEALNIFTRHCPAVLVLKGAGTLVGQAGSPTVLSPFAVPGLAVGGSGDVLSGVIAALVATGFSSFDAASLGVYLHARAGELLARKSPVGHLASDIADAVPESWKELWPA